MRVIQKNIVRLIRPLLLRLQPLSEFCEGGGAGGTRLIFQTILRTSTICFK